MWQGRITKLGIEFTPKKQDIIPKSFLMCKIIFQIKCNFGYILLLGHLRLTAVLCHICHIPQNTFIKPSYQPHAMWATHEDKTCDLKTTPVLFSRFNKSKSQYGMPQMRNQILHTSWNYCKIFIPVFCIAAICNISIHQTLTYTWC